MIDPKKQYKTRDGREVRIYAVDGGGHRPVHGAIREGQVWVACAWFHDGVAGLHCNALIEVKPRIQREVWVNVFEHCCGIHDTEDKAGYFDKNGLSIRIACVKLTIDCEEGEGL
jgi:hypothetical protein